MKRLINILSLAIAALVALTGCALTDTRARAEADKPDESYMALYLTLDYDNESTPHPGETVRLKMYHYVKDAAYTDTLAPERAHALMNARLRIDVKRTSGDIAQSHEICDMPLAFQSEGAWVEWAIPEEYEVGDTLVFTARVLEPDGGVLCEDHWETTLDHMVISQEVYLKKYEPYIGERTVYLDEPSTLRFTDNLPEIDGATALFPVYAAFAQAVYEREHIYNYGEEEYSIENDLSIVHCSATSGAYKSLIKGYVDMIFVAQPSDAQLKLAEDAGVKLRLTPIGSEAFVFIVNEQNPVDGLTVDQIRRVYSGEITDWAELGAPDLGAIAAYQRAENSGSQTALKQLMGDARLIEPPKEQWIDDMMGLLTQVASYRNSAAALGYSFRFYVTTLQQAPVKLLKLDGVYPSEENISNLSYPVISTLYAVTREGDETENTLKLLDWVTGEQGQTLVKKVGYTPIMPITLPEPAEDAPKPVIDENLLKDMSIRINTIDTGDLSREGFRYIANTSLCYKYASITQDTFTPDMRRILENATLRVYTEDRISTESEDSEKFIIYEGPIDISMLGTTIKFNLTQNDAKYYYIFAQLISETGEVLMEAQNLL